MDTGLLVSLAFKNKDYLENELYQAILFDKLHVNEGMLVENIIAQAFRSKGEKVFYYKKVNRETKKTEAEIDFLIRRNNKIALIEAKSSDSNSVESLKKVKTMFSDKISKSIVLHEDDIKIEENIIYLPYYFAFVIWLRKDNCYESRSILEKPLFCMYL